MGDRSGAYGSTLNRPHAITLTGTDCTERSEPRWVSPTGTSGTFGGYDA